MTFGDPSGFLAVLFPLAGAVAALWWHWPKARYGSAPTNKAWWPAILAIERFSDDPALAFRTRTDRLVWYAIGPAGRYSKEFSGLWQNPFGHWFYLDVQVTDNALFSGRTKPLKPAVVPLTPRRAYNVLLPYPRLLAREFPHGPPRDADASSD